MNSLGMLHMYAGDVLMACRTLQKALELLASHLPPQDAGVVGCAENLAGALLAQGRGMEAAAVQADPASVPIPRCSGCGKASSTHSACSRCRTVRYCEAACQRKHWVEHKQYCKDLASAAAKAAAGL